MTAQIPGFLETQFENILSVKDMTIYRSLKLILGYIKAVLLLRNMSDVLNFRIGVWKQLAFAFFAASTVLFFNYLARAAFRDYIPMSLFFMAIAFSAWFGGFRAGIFATLLGAFAEFYFLMDLENFFKQPETGIARFVIYIIEGGLISYFVGFYQNKYALRSNRLQEKMKQAETANRIKSLFLANMSHEIRTPLTGLLGFTDLLLAEPDMPKDLRQEYIQIIRRTGQNLTDLINDILDLSKVEAGHMKIEKADLQIYEFLSEIQSLLGLKANEKHLYFQLTIDPSVPHGVRVDSARLRQILLNVVGNAIKFTQKGYVKIICSAQNSNLVFRIEDSGIGIRQGQQHKLFQTFSQIDESHSRKFAGTGLGLSLSKQLARLMGGQLELLHSQYGFGSIFQLQIPFECSSIRAKSSRASLQVGFSPKSLQGKSVLIVDDSIDNQYFLTQFLQKYGCKTSTASDGSEVLRTIEQKSFDIILLDMQMPIMDGYTTAKKLRQRKDITPIVALTANVMKEDRDRCLKSGCNAYVSKPIHTQELLQTMQSILFQKSPALAVH